MNQIEEVFGARRVIHPISPDAAMRNERVAGMQENGRLGPDLLLDGRDGFVQGIDQLQVQTQELPMMIADVALEGLRELLLAGVHTRAGQFRQRMAVGLARDDRAQNAPAAYAVTLVRTLVSLMLASSRTF